MPHRADPNYHDMRAKTLLEAAQRLRALAEEQPSRRLADGVREAAAELKRMASAARREHRRLSDVRRKETGASEAKDRAFGGQAAHEADAAEARLERGPITF